MQAQGSPICPMPRVCPFRLMQTQMGLSDYTFQPQTQLSLNVLCTSVKALHWCKMYFFSEEMTQLAPFSIARFHLTRRIFFLSFFEWQMRRACSSATKIYFTQHIIIEGVTSKALPLLLCQQQHPLQLRYSHQPPRSPICPLCPFPIARQMSSANSCIAKHAILGLSAGHASPATQLSALYVHFFSTPTPAPLTGSQLAPSFSLEQVWPQPRM